MKSRGLMHVYCLLKVTMMKYILHIKLMNIPMLRDNKTENNPDGGRFDHQTKGLITVNTPLLIVPVFHLSVLYQDIEPSTLNLCLNSHMDRTMFDPGRHGKRTQVRLVIRALYSLCMALR